MYRVVFVFFFFSGFTSLVFEVLWERELQQIFGTTSFALSTLLTAFMSGLALGSLVGGRWAARLRRPLRVYGLLEGSIGLYALLVPVLLDALPSLYSAMFSAYLDDFYLFSLLRFVTVFAVLVVPTTLMGATLPIVSQWVAQRQRLFQGSIGLLYGCNTFGACCGALLAGFVLLPALGLSTTNTAFALSNFALCATVLLLERRLEADRSEPDEDAILDDIAGRRGSADPLGRRLSMLALVAFACAGAVSMSYQVLWTRAYVIILGSSTYSFTVILTSFLVGLSGGSALMSALIDRIRRPLWWLALTQLGVAAFATVAFFVLDRLPEWLFYRLRGDIGNVSDVYVYNFVLVGSVVLVPTLLQGMSFPLIVRALVGDREASGKRVGRLYAINTGGAIVGSFAAGFVLMPLLGLHDAIALVVGLNLAIGLAVAAGELGAQRSTRAVLGLVAASVVACAAFLAAPEIDRVKLTRGMFRVYWARELFDPKKLKRDSPKLLFYQDGLTATISVEKRGKLVTLKANGKPEASDGADMATQILVGLLPFVVRSGDPRRVLGRERAAMVGYGSGVTAGASLQWPLQELEVVELEEAMVGASRYFDHVNHRPLDDPRTKLVLNDGRNHLEYSPKRYDVIVSEPSNPWIAGVASLFTVEHFTRAKRHLEPGGLFAQWVQIYELRPINVRRIMATFLEVFPHVIALSSKAKGTDLILIGSEEPIPMPAEGYARAWAIPTVRAEMQRAGVAGPHDLVGLMFMNRHELEVFSRGAELNTDDNGLLEFEAPKDLVRYDVGNRFFAKRYHNEALYGDPRPLLPNWPQPQAWSEDNLGHLARATWLAGKPKLGDALLADHGFGPTTRTNDVAPGPLRDYLGVRAVESLDLGRHLVERWPWPESALRSMLADIVVGGKETQGFVYLESDQRPDKDGYSGERGMIYAYLLWKRRYTKNAKWQMERLRREADPVVVESLAFRWLEAAVHAKRMHYDKAWPAYREVAARLEAEILGQGRAKQISAFHL